MRFPLKLSRSSWRTMVGSVNNWWILHGREQRDVIQRLHLRKDGWCHRPPAPNIHFMPAKIQTEKNGKIVTFGNSDWLRVRFHYKIQNLLFSQIDPIHSARKVCSCLGEEGVKAGDQVAANSCRFSHCKGGGGWFSGKKIFKKKIIKIITS